MSSPVFALSDDHWLNKPGLVDALLFAGALIFVIRLTWQMLAPPLPDEAYYWLWGQRWVLSRSWWKFKGGVISG